MGNIPLVPGLTPEQVTAALDFEAAVRPGAQRLAEQYLRGLLTTYELFEGLFLLMEEAR